MSFAPVNGEHAIEKVAFFVKLSQPISEPLLQSVQRQHKLWRADLPAVDRPQIIEMQIDANGTSQQRPHRGLEFSFRRPDNTSVWSAKIIGSDIIIECSRYTRWAKVWPRAEKYIRHFLEIISVPKPEPTVVLLSLITIDVFKSSELVGELNTLFRKGAYTPSFIFECGPAWHHHFGWFDELEGPRILNNVNCDAKLAPIEDGVEKNQQERIVTLQHLQEWQAQPVSIAALIGSSSQALREAMENMHNRNKILMHAMLSEEMAIRVGLSNSSKTKE
ncbi:hypothetical protein APZ41_021405 [Roseomonas mucosa]|uniref:Uncharacterized protein n=1 Tax=Roseomonas mucosa TaxID=207340 RepID=A0A1S8CYL2_9PROT|nr:TIGR04255 family protein [Roseomonas mucosa]MDT8356138.1 TIGR04255 family protein [Roseomonas mucosa]ONH81156.1 hypothetical protein APZ41_021405 [Roseomonas mucosa]